MVEFCLTKMVMHAIMVVQIGGYLQAKYEGERSVQGGIVDTLELVE